MKKRISLWSFLLCTLGSIASSQGAPLFLPMPSRLGGSCTCDTDCPNGQVGTTTLKGICFNGVCAQLFQGNCIYQVDATPFETSDTLHCPPQTNCWNIDTDDYNFLSEQPHAGLCIYKCRELNDSACAGYCETDFGCWSSNKILNQFYSSCTGECAALCQPSLETCAEAVDCLIEKDRAIRICTEDHSGYGSLEECIVNLSLNCTFDDAEIEASARALADCITAHGCDQEGLISSESYYSSVPLSLSCLNDHCAGEMAACYLVDDQVCSINETVETSPNDCAACGDGVCTRFENEGNCPLDCKEVVVETCAQYEDCINRAAICPDCPSSYEYQGFTTIAQCEEHYCQRCVSSDQIQTQYQQMLSCWVEHQCIDSTQTQIDMDCIQNHCAEATGTCHVAGDGICSRLENFSTSPADCHSCGDQICSPEYGEDEESCRFDCAPYQAINCADYYDCRSRDPLLGNIREHNCNYCRINHEALHFSTVEECEDYWCVSCDGQQDDIDAYYDFVFCMESNGCSDFTCGAEHCTEELNACFSFHDGICSPHETVETSPDDCHQCGDRICNRSFEDTQNCPQDCLPVQSNTRCDQALEIRPAIPRNEAHNYFTGNDFDQSPGNDVFFKLVVLEDSIVTLTTEGDGTTHAIRDTVLYLLSNDCKQSNILAQNDDLESGVNLYSQIKTVLKAGEYIVVVDSRDASIQGSFVLTAQMVPEHPVITDCPAIDRCQQGYLNCIDESNSECLACIRGYYGNQCDRCRSGFYRQPGEGDAFTCVEQCSEGYKPEEGTMSCVPNENEPPKTDAGGQDGAVPTADAEVKPQDSAVPTADAAVEPDDGGSSDSGCSAMPSPSAGFKWLPFTLPLLWFRRKRHSI